MKKIIAIIAVIALMAVLGTVLFACVPSNLDKAKAKLEKKDYVVEVEKLEKVSDDGIVGGLNAATKDGKETIQATLFESASKAKDYYNKNKDAAEAMAKAMNLTIGQKGKWVYVGTEAAVKAFK